MQKSRSRHIYEQRIYKVQDYICTHLDQELKLEKIAKISEFSPFYFHRIFKSIAGETLYDFIQRVRLEKSCAMLAAKSDVKIIHIAMSCGFSTASSFSKAFKKHFKVSPSDYRNKYFLANHKNEISNRKNGTHDGKVGKERMTPVEYISDSELEILLNRRKSMHVRIENLPAYRIAYMRQIGSYGSNNIQLMQKLKKWAITRDLLTDTSIILGIAHDDPEVTPSEKCRYDCCIVLSDKYDLEKDMNEAMLPGGQYAIFSVEHTAEAIGKAWHEIFSIWLPDSSYQIDDRPLFERFIGTALSVEPDSCEICIPLKTL